MEQHLTQEEESKDVFFKRVAEIGEEMIAAHGGDFATGAFVLAARWISEGKMRGKPAGKAASGSGKTLHS